MNTKGIGYYGQDFLVIKENEDLVSESIARIIMTNKNERVGQPQFGADLKASIFEQLDTDSMARMEDSLNELISLYEPRAIVRSLTVVPDEESQVTISVLFNYIGSPNVDPRLLTLTINLER